MSMTSFELDHTQKDLRQSVCPVCGFQGLGGCSQSTSAPTTVTRTKLCPQCGSRLEFEFSLIRCHVSRPKRTRREHKVDAMLAVGTYRGGDFVATDATKGDIAGLVDLFDRLPETLRDEATDDTRDVEWQIAAKWLAAKKPTLHVEPEARRVTSWPGPVRLMVADEDAWLDYVLDRNEFDKEFTLDDMPNVVPEGVKLALDQGVARLVKSDGLVLCEVACEDGPQTFRFDETREREYEPDEYLAELGVERTSERIAWALHAMHYESVTSNKRWKAIRDAMKAYKTYVTIEGKVFHRYDTPRA